MTAHTLKVTSDWGRIESVTTTLRFVQRGQSKILQQLVTWVGTDGDGHEWRDVPLVTETR